VVSFPQTCRSPPPKVSMHLCCLLLTGWVYERAQQLNIACTPSCNLRRSFQKFCTQRSRGQLDEAIVLIFATVVSQTSVKNNVWVLAGYVVRVLQNGALKWKKNLTGVRSRAVTSDHTITRSLMPQVQYRKFWKSTDGKCFPTRRTVLTWAHQPLTCSQNWRNHSVGKRFRSTEEVSNEVTQVIRRIKNEVVLTGLQDLPQRWTAVIKAQWRLHWRTVNVFCEINSFLKRKRKLCRSFEMDPLI